MNVRAAKDEISLLFPNNASYGETETNFREAEPARKQGGLASSLARAVTWIMELPRRHAVLTELEMMSDRELADIGLGRGELSKVFHSDFASARGKARANGGPSRISTGV